MAKIFVALTMVIGACASVPSQYRARLEACDALPEAQIGACYRAHPLRNEPVHCAYLVHGEWTDRMPRQVGDIEAESTACWDRTYTKWREWLRESRAREEWMRSREESRALYGGWRRGAFFEAAAEWRPQPPACTDEKRVLDVAKALAATESFADLYEPLPRRSSSSEPVERFAERLSRQCLSDASQEAATHIAAWPRERASSCASAKGPLGARLKGCEETPASTSLGAEKVASIKAECRRACLVDVSEGWAREARKRSEFQRKLDAGEVDAWIGGQTPIRDKARYEALRTGCVSDCQGAFGAWTPEADRVDALRGCADECASWARSESR